MLDQAPPTAGVIIGSDQGRRQVPHLFEVAIVRHDLAVEIDHQNAVGGGFKGRLKH